MNPARGVDITGAYDTGWYRDRVGVVDVVFVHGKMSEESFEHFLAVACRTLDELADDAIMPTLMDVREPALMDSRWRQRVTRALQERREKLARTCPAFAMVTPSLVVRAALKVMYWAEPPPHPHTVVASLEDGFAFLAQRVPGLDARATQAEYERRRDALLTTVGAR